MAHAMQELLHRKGIYATFDYWGHDAEHHWYWWQKMLRHHLEPLWHEWGTRPLTDSSAWPTP